MTTRYTSFVGCAVVLHGASQKLLQGQAQEISLELAYASSHICLLSLCSYNNEIARKMYTTVQVVFNEIREIAALQITNNSHVSDTSTHFSQGPTAQSPNSAASNIVDIAKRVMHLLRVSIDL